MKRLLKSIQICIFIFSTYLLISAVHHTRFSIKGVSGEILDNAKARLHEINQVKPLTSLSTKALQTQIATSLTPYGYFNPVIHVQSIGKGLKIIVNKGPLTHITSIDVKLEGEGAHDFEINKARRNLAIKVGQPFNNQKYIDAKESLLNAAEHRGYLRSSYKNAELIIDKKINKAKIVWVFDSGPLYYFGQVQFSPSYICPELLHRFVHFHPGIPYSTDKVIKLNNDLSASAYFKNVTIKPQIGDKKYVPIVAHLEDAQRVNYNVGMGFGTDTGVRGRMGYYVIPVNRLGHKFSIVGQGSHRENNLQAQYLIPGRNPVNDQYTINGGLSSLNYNSGYGNAMMASIAHQRSLKNYQHILSINALNERFNYDFNPKFTESVFFPKASFTVKKITNPMFSPSGFNINLTGFAASRKMLSDLSTSQGEIDIRAALRIEPLRARIYGHTAQAITAIDNIYQLPVSLALLLGGANNMKGFSYNEIGPGKRLTYAGIELQKETIKNWYVIGFVDSGDVYNPTPKSTLYDAGIALMWVSPVGPIKVGIAQPTTKKFSRLRNDKPRLVINMGPDL